MVFSKDGEELIAFPQGESRDYIIPANVKELHRGAFYDCESLGDVVIPEGVAAIPEDCFYNCYAMQNVALPQSLTTICESAFWNCMGLMEIEIPESVTYIAPLAFLGCMNLVRATIYGTPTIDDGEDYGVFVYFEEDDMSYKNLPVLEIYGYGGTKVETYCTGHSIPFHALVFVEYGDVDGSGVIDLGDITLLAKYVAGWSLGDSVYLENADCDASGEIDLADITLLAKYVAGWNVILGPYGMEEE